ncbi:MAG: hypothetical protein AAF441_10495 [Pseudomonadota bacterium]
MKSRTWRPERRNRKSGTAAAGHGQANRMTIPQCRLDRFGRDTRYYERVRPSRVEKLAIGSTDIWVLFEQPRENFTYGCSPEDAVHLLSLLPEEDVELIDCLVFRQPTRKQVSRCPVWGRLQYLAMIGSFIGPAVLLEAQEVGAKIKWGRKLNVEDQAELERLKSDGHDIQETSRGWIFTLSEQSIRQTLLYRTLLHEIGHWVHYETEVLWDRALDVEQPDGHADIFFARPSRELEQFAHAYAAKTGKRLKDAGHVPFDPLK